MRRSAARLVALLVLLVLTSCGPRTLGQAVVLWGRVDGPPSGAVLPVVARSSIDNTVTLWDRQTRTRHVLEAWRVRDDFRKLADAQAYKALIEPYRETFAFTDRSDGLPIREKPDTQSVRIYRVAPAQLVKVLGRGETKATEGVFEGYWYEVLTDDGYRGYTFGLFLRIFEATDGRERERMEAILAEDPVLDKLFGGVWRPEYYADMLKSGRIDLRRFTPQIGLFPDRQASTWKLKMLDLEVEMAFDRVENPATGVYTFPPADLRITVYPGDRLDVSYRRDGRLARTVFVQIPSDVDEVILEETERRGMLRAAFLERGGGLVSNAYGSIALSADGRFRWTDFGRVPAGVFVRPVSGLGVIDFPNHLSAALTSTYAGAVSLVFDEYAPGDETVFLYSYVSGGLQLTRVLPQDIENLEIRRVSPSPLVMFFTFQGR